MKALFQLVSAIQEWRVGMSDPIGDLSGRILQRWIFLLFPSGATRDYFFFFFVQKYSIWSVLCRNIHIMVYCEKILVRYRYMLHENEANQWITCRFSKFLIQLCKKKRFLWGFVLKYYFFGGSCRNITVPRYWASEVLCRALFRGCAEILVLGRNIHLCPIGSLFQSLGVPPYKFMWQC